MKRISLIMCLVLAAAVARGYDQPSVNLGATSFLDGAPPAGPGFYFTEYLQYYHSERFKDSPGQADLGVFASLNQLIYQSDQKLPGGGKWGLNFILPVVAFDAGSPLTENSGLGDLNIGPFLQWDPIMGQNGPVLFNRIEFTCIVPTGAYDANRSLNAGSNFFSFNPYWAATWLPSKKCEVSWRLHYLWNDENSDNRRQPGQAIHFNLATSYELIAKRLRAGINSYYLKQITDSESSGVAQSGREQVFGIGPGLLYSFSQNDHLFLNVYFEMAGENRTEGERFNLRWVHHF